MRYEEVKEELRKEPKKFLLTGGAGFIGSNILQELLLLDQEVVVLDNLSTGYIKNIDDVKESVGNEKAANLTFVEGDIRDFDLCFNLIKETDIVIHEAALGSVPRSIKNPQESESVNVMGFINILQAMAQADKKRIVFASSSSVYGDITDDTKTEERTGTPLSPYALTKVADEAYAKLFNSLYGIDYIALRYFNVFGKRQDPKSVYAAVIPLWIDNIINKRKCTINGDGETSRDFCYVQNVVQANILGAMTTNKDALNKTYNIAFGQRTTLNELYDMIVTTLENDRGYKDLDKSPIYGPFRKGDIRHSLASIEKAKTFLGYNPKYSIRDGMKEYLQNF